MCRPKERTHKHHIIPRYMEGPDTPENLVEVTVTQHAMFHFCNYQLWGNEEDKIAWRSLSGQITIDEAKQEAKILGCIKGGKIIGKRFKKLGVGIFAMSPEEKSKAGQKGAQILIETNMGIHGMSSEEKSMAGKIGGKIGGQKSYENGVGIFSISLEEKSKIGKKAAETNRKNGTAVYGLKLEERIEAGKRGGKISGKKAKENKTGIFAISAEEKSEIGKKSAKKQHAQRWQCTKTGYISTPCGLSAYQKARGIDTSNRIRIQ